MLIAGLFSSTLNCFSVMVVFPSWLHKTADFGVAAKRTNITGKGGNWRTKLPDAEPAIGAAPPKVRVLPTNHYKSNFYLFLLNARIIVIVIATPRETPNTNIIQKPASVGFDDILSPKTKSIENVIITEMNAPTSGYLRPLFFSIDITVSLFVLFTKLHHSSCSVTGLLFYLVVRWSRCWTAQIMAFWVC
jgi:hypothetical protein